MGDTSLVQDFRTAPFSRKLRYLFWMLPGTAIVFLTVWVIAVILRIHFLGSPLSDRAEDRLAALTAAKQRQSEMLGLRKAREEARKPVGPATTAAEPPAAAFTYPYEIRGIAVPIANHHQTKAIYLQFTVVYDCPSPAAVEIMQMSRAKLRSVLYETAMHYSEDDFRSASGFDRFRNEVVAVLKAAFGDQAPRTIALRDLLVN